MDLPTTPISSSERELVEILKQRDFLIKEHLCAFNDYENEDNIDYEKHENFLELREKLSNSCLEHPITYVSYGCDYKVKDNSDPKIAPKKISKLEHIANQMEKVPESEAKRRKTVVNLSDKEKLTRLKTLETKTLLIKPWTNFSELGMTRNILFVGQQDLKDNKITVVGLRRLYSILVEGKKVKTINSLSLIDTIQYFHGNIEDIPEEELYGSVVKNEETGELELTVDVHKEERKIKDNWLERNINFAITTGKSLWEEFIPELAIEEQVICNELGYSTKYSNQLLHAFIFAREITRIIHQDKKELIGKTGKDGTIVSNHRILYKDMFIEYLTHHKLASRDFSKRLWNILGYSKRLTTKKSLNKFKDNDSVIVLKPDEHTNQKFFYDKSELTCPKTVHSKDRNPSSVECRALKHTEYVQVPLTDKRKGENVMSYMNRMLVMVCSYKSMAFIRGDRNIIRTLSQKKIARYCNVDKQFVNKVHRNRLKQYVFQEISEQEYKTIKQANYQGDAQGWVFELSDESYREVTVNGEVTNVPLITFWKLQGYRLGGLGGCFSANEKFYVDGEEGKVDKKGKKLEKPRKLVINHRKKRALKFNNKGRLTDRFKNSKSDMVLANNIPASILTTYGAGLFENVKSNQVKLFDSENSEDIGIHGESSPNRLDKPMEANGYKRDKRKVDMVILDRKLTNATKKLKLFAILSADQVSGRVISNKINEKGFHDKIFFSMNECYGTPELNFLNTFYKKKELGKTRLRNLSFDKVSKTLSQLFGSRISKQGQTELLDIVDETTGEITTIKTENSAIPVYLIKHWRYIASLTKEVREANPESTKYKSLKDLMFDPDFNLEGIELNRYERNCTFNGNVISRNKEITEWNNGRRLELQNKDGKERKKRKLLKENNDWFVFRYFGDQATKDFRFNTKENFDEIVRSDVRNHSRSIIDFSIPDLVSSDVSFDSHNSSPSTTITEALVSQGQQ